MGYHRSAQEAAKCPAHGHATPRVANTPINPAPMPAPTEPVKTVRMAADIEVHEWYLDGVLHREGGPAHVRVRPGGRVKWEEWCQQGERHRADGPALIEYLPDGRIDCEEWWQNGDIHRDDGPAVIYYDESGQPSKEQWVLDGTMATEHQVRAPSWGISRDNAAAIAFLSAFDCDELSAEHPAVTLALATHKNP